MDDAQRLTNASGCIIKFDIHVLKLHECNVAAWSAPPVHPWASVHELRCHTMPCSFENLRALPLQ